MAGGYQGPTGYPPGGPPPQGPYGQPQYSQPQYGQPQYGQPNPGYAQPYGHAYSQQGPMQGGPGFLPPDAYAGFWIRFVAYLIDALVLAIPSMIVSAVVFAALGFSPGVMFDFNARQNMAMNQEFQLANNLANVAQLLVFWPYYGLMHSRMGATLGKLALGLRVVDDTGQFPSFGRASGRYFATILSACLCTIGYIWAGFHPQKRALHDLIAGTYVVRKQFAPQAPQA